MGLVSCGCTLCDRLPAQPDWPSGDCVAVVHGLGHRMVSKVMGMRWVQRSSGAVYDWFVWVVIGSNTLHNQKESTYFQLLPTTRVLESKWK